MRKRKVYAFVVLLAMSVVMLTGCGNDKHDGGSAGSGSNQTEQLKPEAEELSYEVTDARAKTWTDSIGTVWVQTIVEVSNNGTANIYLSSGSYDLEDSAGNLIASQSLVSAYPDVIAPGEKGYMYEETTLDKPFEGELTVVPRVKAEKAAIDIVRLPVTDLELSNDDLGDLKMMGRVENTGEEDQDMVYISAFLYNADGVCVGVMDTILMDTLAAGDKVGFEMTSFSMPDDISADGIANYTVYAYPMQMQL